MASFKNCELLWEVMAFQLPSLFVCTMDMMNHIIGKFFLFACTLFNDLISYLYMKALVGLACSTKQEA